MNRKSLFPFWIFVVSLTLVALACNLSVQNPSSATSVAPTQTLFALPTVIPSQTALVPPSNPPESVVENTPAPAPEIPATQAEPIMADVQDYYEKGYLPYSNGEMISLPDFSRSQPESKVHDMTRIKTEAQDFALWADIELNTIGTTKYPNYTGCGFVYRAQNNSEGYTAILTNNYVRMGACSDGMRACNLFGTTFGTGEVDVGNKTKTPFSLAVNKDRAYVFVNGILAGQYSLYTTKLLGVGALYYDVVSNYGAGAWTTCKMTNVKLWESRP